MFMDTVVREIDARVLWTSVGLQFVGGGGLGGKSFPC